MRNSTDHVPCHTSKHTQGAAVAASSQCRSRRDPPPSDRPSSNDASSFVAWRATRECSGPLNRSYRELESVSVRRIVPYELEPANHDRSHSCLARSGDTLQTSRMKLSCTPINIRSNNVQSNCSTAGLGCH